MKSTVLYHYYGPERRNGLCRSFNTKHYALTSAVYTLNVSILVVLLYSWQINVNAKKFQVLGDVYYGIQIAYYAIIGSQLSMAFLSMVLIVGINSENIGLVVPWMLGLLIFMSLEALCTVYANILRDHINGHFDGLCKAEVTVAMYFVMKFYHMVRSGISFKVNETVIEL
ncbi:CLUMA_CG010013, isoform A [Clunio marinus]|uniref:CLUMA_CG010013, isoform A n=1 Tax=Clunio marinus TaxID=568069 RepID=A0A1J1I8I8_9DIPT|nr:CLUMA_CG010013, isoform A [Clunio marinus]